MVCVIFAEVVQSVNAALEKEIHISIDIAHAKKNLPDALWDEMKKHAKGREVRNKCTKLLARLIVSRLFTYAIYGSESIEEVKTASSAVFNHMLPPGLFEIIFFESL